MGNDQIRRTQATSAKADLRTASREALLAVIARQQAIIDGELDTEALRNLASTIFIGRRR